MSDPPPKPVEPKKPYTGNMEDWEVEATLKEFDEAMELYHLKLGEWNDYWSCHDDPVFDDSLMKPVNW